MMIGPSGDNGSARDPAANLRLYDLLKEQNQMAGYLMMGANIRDDPRRGGSAITQHRNDYHKTHQEQTMK